MEQRRLELMNIGAFHIFIVVALVVFECLLAHLLFHNFMITLIFVFGPLFIWINNLRDANIREKEKNIRITGFRPKYGSFIYPKFLEVEKLLFSVLSPIKTKKQVTLLAYETDDNNDRLNKTIFTYELFDINYVVVPIKILTLLDLTDYYGVFPHEIAHMVCDHSGQGQFHIQFEVLLTHYHPLVLALFIGILTQTIFLPLLLAVPLIYLGKIISANFKKHQELTADGLAALLGYGNETAWFLRRYSVPDRTLVRKIIRQIDDHPTDDTRLKFISSLTKK